MIKVLLILALAITVTACGAQHGTNQVVEKMYNALAKGDTDAYMDTLRPTNRNMPDLTGVLSTVLRGLGVSAGAVSLDLGGLLTPSFQEMRYTVIANDGDYALVQAHGKLRMMMMEFRFCDTHDLVYEEGNWYVDHYHPARLERVQALTKRNEQQLLNQYPTVSASADPFLYLARSVTEMGPALEIMLNLCES